MKGFTVYAQALLLAITFSEMLSFFKPILRAVLVCKALTESEYSRPWSVWVETKPTAGENKNVPGRAGKGIKFSENSRT